MAVRAFARILAVAIALAGPSACSSLMGFDSAEDAHAMSHDIVITVDSPALHYDASRRAVDATLSVTIRNQGMARVFFHPCGTVLERRVDGEWRQMWFRFCALGERFPETEIAPGTKVTIEVRVTAILGYGVADQWTEPLDGEYRIQLALRDERVVLPEAARVSRPFTLRTE